MREREERSGRGEDVAFVKRIKRGTVHCIKQENSNYWHLLARAIACRVPYRRGDLDGDWKDLVAFLDWI